MAASLNTQNLAIKGVGSLFFLVKQTVLRLHMFVDQPDSEWNDFATRPRALPPSIRPPTTLSLDRLRDILYNSYNSYIEYITGDFEGETHGTSSRQ